MCIRDSPIPDSRARPESARRFRQSHRDQRQQTPLGCFCACLLYTSDAADERSSVDLGGRRIIKKKTKVQQIEYDEHKI